MGETVGVILRKLHGWGNDFLVAHDADQPSGPLDPDEVASLASVLCDRRRGVGADGLMHAGIPGPADDVDVVMSLFNADGGRAEMSGNGIRCLAHAHLLVIGALRPEVAVGTDVGQRVLTVRSIGTTSDGVPAQLELEVPMGEVTPWSRGAVADVLADVGLGSLRHLALDVGNPHVVLEVADPDDMDLEVLGARIETLVDGGINVEIAAPHPHGGVAMRVWERGVGLTQACGTGACATAFAMRTWGLADDEVEVHMPGGTARVVLSGDMARLIGPSVAIARLEVADS